MPITRIAEQKSETLEEYYREISENDTYLPDRGKAMLALLEIINGLFKETTIWALTSIDRLVLLTENDSRTNWLIIISCLNSKEIYFEYIIPAVKGPGPTATVKSKASSLEEAKRYLLVAMLETEGWSDNQELSLLLKDYQLY